MKTFNLEKFCSDLISLRKNTTQSKVGELLGINKNTLSLLEKGKQTPSLDILSKVCEFGNFSANEYFTDDVNDGLLYLMGSLEENDREKIIEMMEIIKIKEKYEMLSRRCV